MYEMYPESWSHAVAERDRDTDRPHRRPRKPGLRRQAPSGNIPASSRNRQD
jgi:hypothetical protein